MAFAPEPIPETVEALLDTTWRVAAAEAARTDALDRKAASLATFASLVLSLSCRGDRAGAAHESREVPSRTVGICFAALRARNHSCGRGYSQCRPGAMSDGSDDYPR